MRSKQAAKGLIVADKPQISNDLPVPKCHVKLTENVAFKCGHVRPVASYAQEDCGSCRQEKRKARAEARKAKMLVERQNRPAPEESFRWPDGTNFSSIYHATPEQRHEGKAVLPCGHCFTAEDSSIERMQRKLWRFFCEWRDGGNSDECGTGS
jgi:hypothetical protein